LAIARDRRWLWVVLILVTLLPVGVAIHGLGPSLDLVLGGLGSSAEYSAESRAELLSRGLTMLGDFPFTGIGLGMFPYRLSTLYPVFIADPEAEPPHVHNLYLQAGIDHGFPGLIAFLAFVALLLVMAVQAVRQSRGRPWEPLTVGMLAGLVAHLVHGLTDAVGYSPRSHVVVWAYFGLLTAVWRWIRNGEPAG
jgi:O-antigen ligase